jgi:hypothetical protein
MLPMTMSEPERCATPRRTRAPIRREPATASGVSMPMARWDGRRVLFEVSHDGQAVPCAISSAVLGDLSSRRCFKPAEVLECFAAMRGQVEAIARAKLASRVSRPSVPFALWSTDVEDYASASQGGGPGP